MQSRSKFILKVIVGKIYVFF